MVLALLFAVLKVRKCPRRRSREEGEAHSRLRAEKACLVALLMALRSLASVGVASGDAYGAGTLIAVLRAHTSYYILSA